LPPFSLLNNINNIRRKRAITASGSRFVFIMEIVPRFLLRASSSLTAPDVRQLDSPGVAADLNVKTADYLSASNATSMVRLKRRPAGWHSQCNGTTWTVLLNALEKRIYVLCDETFRIPETRPSPMRCVMEPMMIIPSISMKVVPSSLLSNPPLILMMMGHISSLDTGQQYRRHILVGVRKISFRPPSATDRGQNPLLVLHRYKSGIFV
jgi:hypothetical protein